MSSVSNVVRVVIASALVFLFSVPQNLVAQAAIPSQSQNQGQNHLVSPADLQKATVNASQERERNRETIRQFFSSEQAQSALKTAHMDPERVTEAVAHLDDAELAQLAQRTEKAQADFAAGRLSDRDLIIILVAVAVLILVIVAVR